MIPSSPNDHNEHNVPSRQVKFSARSIDEAGEPLSLEGRLHTFDDGALHPGVVLLHANPAAGGHMDMKPIVAVEAALSRRGIATLRYNSRGIGDSEGVVSQIETRQLVAPEGEAEMEDVGAALDFLALQPGVDGRKMGMLGHSFGARILLAYLAAHPEEERVKAVVCVGLGIAWRDLSHLGKWPHPKLFITGERDDFCPPALLEKFADELPGPSNVVTLKRTGHFFEGREHDLGEVAAEFLARVLLG